MLIGIDGNEANVKNRVGSNIYAFELLRWFSKIGRNHQFRIYLKEKPLPDLPKESSNWQYQLVRPKKFSTQFGLPLNLFLTKPRPDVFFTPGHYLPSWAPCPMAMAILDIAYLEFPQMFRQRDLWQLKQWTRKSVKKASRILTISHATKNAIIKHYQIEPKKVVISYPGLRMTQKPQKTELKKYGVEDDFILYVGTLQPRKNLEKLIEAFSLLPDKKLSLALVGKKGWLYDQIFAKVKKMKLTDRVVFTGFVSDEDLPVFYQKAECLVLISLYEGFGIPPLEAMHFGCPVVVSNVSSLPEVVGEAGILVDPKDAKDIAQGIQKAIKNRKSLVAKGKKQVKKFSWEKCARQTLEVLENVARQG